MEFSRIKNIFVVAPVLMFLAVLVFGILPQNPRQFESGPIFLQPAALMVLPGNTTEQITEPEKILPQKLANPPQIIKAIYVTANSAGSTKYLNYLDNIFKTSGVNAVVVDIKGSSGYVSYLSGADYAVKYGLNTKTIKNIDALVNFLHERGVYVIGRIAVFEDPVLAKARPDLAIYNKEKTKENELVLWRDNNGLAWMDPASEDVWDYNISLAKDAFLHGFDEINFDYIRFPTDGKMSNIGFPVYDFELSKREVIKEFFKHLRKELAGHKISADLFGQTTVNRDDMGIGQVMEDAFEYFDYICPMVYPSHYITGFIGFKNPADHPYEIVKYSMDKGASRQREMADYKKSLMESRDELAKDLIFRASANMPYVQTLAEEPEEGVGMASFRPWLQDFDMGAIYDTAMVQSQIMASKDALGEGYAGFMLWNPSNIYTETAVLKEETK